ncbi:MAG: MnmC family methyltransferase, partial [Pseudomonadota bacterium]
GMAEAWFLDGFAPARNPELWEPDLLAEVARHTAPEGTFATYTAAGHVRRTLEAVGFAVERRPGFGRKRHMTAGRLVKPGRAVPN